MLLKTENLSESFLNFFDIAKPISKQLACARILWVLGPVILLFERTASDIWLTSIALLFAASLSFERIKEITANMWARAMLAFLIWCFLASALSEIWRFSVLETLAWLRFPLFAVAIAFWVCRSERLVISFLSVGYVAITAHFFILAAEIHLIGFTAYGRLTWPFGDEMPGSYLAKIGLPLILYSVASLSVVSLKKSWAHALFIMLLVTFTALTGERINLLLLVCPVFLSLALLFVAADKNWLLSLILTAALFFGLLGLFWFFYPQKFYLLTVDFWQRIPVINESDYNNLFIGGLNAWRTSPITGVGTAAFSELCEVNSWMPEGNRCQNHPHNFYVQLLAETGVVGLFLGSWTLASIVVATLVKTSATHSTSTPRAFFKFRRVVFLIPVAFFWPIATSADFFGQYNNIFIWSSVSLALATSRIAHQRLQC